MIVVMVNDTSSPNVRSNFHYGARSRGVSRYVVREWWSNPEGLPMGVGFRQGIAVERRGPDRRVRTPVVVFVLGIPVSQIAIEQAHVDQCEQTACLQKVCLPFGYESSCETVHRAFGEFHPPNGIQGLLRRANHVLFRRPKSFTSLYAAAYSGLLGGGGGAGRNWCGVRKPKGSHSESRAGARRSTAESPDMRRFHPRTYTFPGNSSRRRTQSEDRGCTLLAERDSTSFVSSLGNEGEPFREFRIHPRLLTRILRHHNVRAACAAAAIESAEESWPWNPYCRYSGMTALSASWMAMCVIASARAFEREKLVLFVRDLGDDLIPGDCQSRSTKNAVRNCVNVVSSCDLILSSVVSATSCAAAAAASEAVNPRTAMVRDIIENLRWNDAIHARRNLEEVLKNF